MAKTLANESMHWLDRMSGHAAGFGMKASLHTRSPLAVRITAAGLVMNPVLEEIYSVWKAKYDSGANGRDERRVAGLGAGAKDRDERREARVEAGASARVGSGSPARGGGRAATVSESGDDGVARHDVDRISSGVPGGQPAGAKGVGGELDARATRRVGARGSGAGAPDRGKQRDLDSAGRADADGAGRDLSGLIAGQDFKQSLQPLKALQDWLAQFVLPGHPISGKALAAWVLRNASSEALAKLVEAHLSDAQALREQAPQAAAFIEAVLAADSPPRARLCPA